MDRRQLTAREAAVVDLVAEGRMNSEIARARWGLSLATAQRHLNNSMIKWNCANRAQVVVEAIRGGSASASPSVVESGSDGEGAEDATVIPHSGNGVG